MDRGGGAVCQLPLLAALASLYTASLSDDDAAILRLLQRLEGLGLTLSHVNYQWGRPIALPIAAPVAPRDFGALLFEMRAVDASRLVASVRAFPFNAALAASMKSAPPRTHAHTHTRTCSHTGTLTHTHSRAGTLSSVSHAS